MSDGNVIRIAPHEAREHANEIGRNAAIVGEQVQEISDLLARLKPTFLGEASSAFYEAFYKKKTEMEDWKRIVDSFAQELRQAADDLERKDREEAARMRSRR